MEDQNQRRLVEVKKSTDAPKQDGEHNNITVKTTDDHRILIE